MERDARRMRRDRVGEITGRVVLPALIIKTVGHFMADYRTHTTVVESIVRGRIKVWRL